MSKKPNKPGSLRTEAEAQVTRKPVTLVQPQPGEELLHELLHELRVHQIELEMQNDELRRLQIALEESRDRYADLYEFAPVGYLTLDREGIITEANLTAATLCQPGGLRSLAPSFAKYVAARLPALRSETQARRWDGLPYPTELQKIDYRQQHDTTRCAYRC